MPLTPEFMSDLETRMQLITEDTYNGLAADQSWRSFATSTTGVTRRKRLLWLLETAGIKRNEPGNRRFEEIVSRTFDYEYEHADDALELEKSQLEDLDGNGVELAAHWSKQVAKNIAYWPQKVVTDAVKANPTCYDDLAFFHAAHPLNPYDDVAGTYANEFTGGASGVYPGALPISGNTIDAAIANIGKLITYVAGIPTANGEFPRKLKCVSLIVPPALADRATQITDAKIVAMAAAGGGAGSANVEAVISRWALGKPIVVDELGAAFGGSDSTYYVGTAPPGGASEMGAFIHDTREAFAVLYHGPMTSAELARARKFQWLVEGRDTVQPGHPYLMMRCKAT